MSVYTITHKEFNKRNEKGYKTLLVGAHKGHVFGDCYDDENDNISEKNGSYCELTGLYWVWKNVKDEYVGITHYRRYFSRSFGQKKILKESDILSKLEKYDVILPFRAHLNVSVQEHYCEESGYQKDLNLVREIIEKKYPEYLAEYDSFMKGSDIHFFNMMICKKDVYNEYCEWLFDILFELESQVSTDDYNDYQKRIYGFISERLLNVFVAHKQLKVCEAGVINTEENWSLSKRLLTGCKRSIRFALQ